MTKITLTRHYSGFQNIDDTYALGNHETVDSSVSEYLLPEGYQIDDGVIRDRAGFECGIFQHNHSDQPQLISMAGPTRESPVLKIA